AIMIIYLFSKTLSVPLRQLTAIVNEINNGNFNTELFSLLKEDGKDEIGVLAKSTKNERQILNTFTTLTNRGVTEAIIKKQIDFKPHLKDITIFFSDIRGFTAISDGFKKRFGGQSAGEIINFLNDYMSRMVMCIQLTGGTVDKFEGDAIMACWGVLRNDSMDWEELPYSSPVRAQKQFIHDQYVCRDALSAITSCIAMRYALMKYNKDAEAFTAAHAHNPKAQYKPHIKIGAGLNSGRATVGFLGSKHKMEFTSIGDAVNFASRAESSNKPCGTDILITEDTYNLLAPKYIKCAKNNYRIAPENRKNEVIVEQIPVEFDVKGKGKQHFYGVVNMPNFDIQAFFSRGDPKFQIDMDCARAAGRNGPKSLTEVRKLLGIDEPDFMKVDLNAEENKIQVAAN
ncbi:MAG TPA: adenylate/guanylate cyclase domain-containing protein, partial [Treponema sp.]|nr:adenylate/guanylate cyclase domain-containing protein [Treponema sp.]